MVVYPLIDPYALKQDGSTPLTGNWNVGGYNITGIEDLTVVDTINTAYLTATAGLIVGSLNGILEGSTGTLGVNSELTDWLDYVTLDGTDGSVTITGGGSFVGDIFTDTIYHSGAIAISAHSGQGTSIIFYDVGSGPTIGTPTASGIDLSLRSDGNINFGSENLTDGGANSLTIANAKAAYTHSQVSGGIHEDWTSSSANFDTTGTLDAGVTTLGATTAAAVTLDSITGSAYPLDITVPATVAGAWRTTHAFYEGTDLLLQFVQWPATNILALSSGGNMRLYPNATLTENSGTIDIYGATLNFRATNMWSYGNLNYARTGTATDTASQVGSKGMYLQSGLWTGAAAANNQNLIINQASTSVDLEHGILFKLDSNLGGAAIDALYLCNDGSARFEVNPVLPKASGSGIKIDTTTPTFGWRDLLGEPTTKNTGATKPSYEAYNGAIDGFRYSDGDEEQHEYHIPHDYVLGTDIYLHIHWSQISTTNTGGTIDFKYFAVYSKGHDQAAFTSTPITDTITSADAGSTQYQHFITEQIISGASATAALFDRDDIEPDGVILLTLEMDTNNLTDSSAVTDPFIHFVDIHYQSTNIATKDKAPDFYA